MSGRTVLVTGGTSGIGRCCVERFTADGETVVFTGRRTRDGSAVAAATGATFIESDARDRTAVAAAVGEAARIGGGRLDVLVANAGIIIRTPLAETTAADFREVLAVNATHVFAACRAAFPVMRDQGGGAIVVIASEAGLRGIHRIPAYSVSKAAAVAIAEIVGVEGARHRIRANAICPGELEFDMHGATGDREMVWPPGPTFPLPPDGRRATGEEIAAAAAWLTGPEATHITATTLRIDGGVGGALRASETNA